MTPSAVQSFHEMVDHFRHRVLKAHNGIFVAVTYRVSVVSGPGIKPDPQINRQLLVADSQGARWLSADAVPGCGTATLAFAADRKVPWFPGKTLPKGTVTTVAVYLVPRRNSVSSWVDRPTGSQVALPHPTALRGVPS
jgi:hypothetical protein